MLNNLFDKIRQIGATLSDNNLKARNETTELYTRMRRQMPTVKWSDLKNDNLLAFHVKELALRVFLNGEHYIIIADGVLRTVVSDFAEIAIRVHRRELAGGEPKAEAWVKKATQYVQHFNTSYDARRDTTSNCFWGPMSRILATEMYDHLKNRSTLLKQTFDLCLQMRAYACFVYLIPDRSDHLDSEMLSRLTSIKLRLEVYCTAVYLLLQMSCKTPRCHYYWWRLALSTFPVTILHGDGIVAESATDEISTLSQVHATSYVSDAGNVVLTKAVDGITEVTDDTKALLVSTRFEWRTSVEGRRLFNETLAWLTGEVDRVTVFASVPEVRAKNKCTKLTQLDRFLLDAFNDTAEFPDDLETLNPFLSSVLVSVDDFRLFREDVSFRNSKAAREARAKLDSVLLGAIPNDGGSCDGGETEDCEGEESASDGECSILHAARNAALLDLEKHAPSSDVEQTAVFLKEAIQDVMEVAIRICDKELKAVETETKLLDSISVPPHLSISANSSTVRLFGLSDMKKNTYPTAYSPLTLILSPSKRQAEIIDERRKALESLYRTAFNSFTRNDDVRRCLETFLFEKTKINRLLFDNETAVELYANYLGNIVPNPNILNVDKTPVAPASPYPPQRPTPFFPLGAPQATMMGQPTNSVGPFGYGHWNVPSSQMTAVGQPTAFGQWNVPSSPAMYANAQMGPYSSATNQNLLYPDPSSNRTNGFETGNAPNVYAGTNVPTSNTATFSTYHQQQPPPIVIVNDNDESDVSNPHAPVDPTYGGVDTNENPLDDDTSMHYSEMESTRPSFP